jgi:acyl-CoA synthetase (AMP-forming)/AMP-acid ligase II
VVPHPDQNLSFDELIAFPHRRQIVDELPVSPVGKILKRQRREVIALKLQQEQHP